MDPVSLSALAIVALVVVLALPALVVWRKGRPAASGEVFRASRLSGGNRLFPTQVIVTPHSVVHYTPQWIGRHEHSIHIAHVSSVRIDTGLMFSDVVIETMGDAYPILRERETEILGAILREETAFARTISGSCRCVCSSCKRARSCRRRCSGKRSRQRVRSSLRRAVCSRAS